jgi:hypothetical protein
VNGGAVKLTPTVSVERPGADAEASATSGLTIIRPESSDYATTVGTIVRQVEGSPDPKITLDVPEAVKAAMTATLEKTPASDQNSAAKQLLAQLGKRIPGAIAASRSATVQATGTARIQQIGKALGGKFAKLTR